MKDSNPYTHMDIIQSIFWESIIPEKVATCRKTVKRTMTRAVVRKSSLEDDGWLIDWSTDWWEERHDKMTTSNNFQDKKDMVHLCHNDNDKISG